jgi:hypothetical protein
MTVFLPDAHAHVQRLVSVVKMATVLEVCNTEEQRSFVLIQREMFPFLLWEVSVA